MKRYLLLSFAVAIKMVISAQTGMLPLVVEGRTWNTVSLIPSNPQTDSDPDYYKDIKGRWGRGVHHTFVLKGDTVMGGLTYMRLFLDDKFVAGVREEGGRIYECYWEDFPEEMVFDFTLQSGDTFTSGDELNKLQVKQVRQFCLEGQSRQCLDIWGYEEGAETADGLVDYWIEGIGCMGGPYSPFWWTATSQGCLLLSCYDGDECIFSLNDFRATLTSMRDLNVDKDDSTSSVYNLQGQQLRTTPLRGIYIKNGRKRLYR